VINKIYLDTSVISALFDERTPERKLILPHKLTPTKTRLKPPPNPAFLPSDPCPEAKQAK